MENSSKPTHDPQLLAACNHAVNRFGRYATKVLEAAAESEIHPMTALYVVRSHDGKRFTVQPLPIDCSNGFPKSSAILVELEALYATTAPPILLGTFTFGAMADVKDASQPPEIRQCCYIIDADLVGRTREKMRSWTPDGPVGPWQSLSEHKAGDSVPASSVASMLSRVLNLAAFKPEWMTGHLESCPMYGKPVKE